MINHITKIKKEDTNNMLDVILRATLIKLQAIGIDEPLSVIVNGHMVVFNVADTLAALDEDDLPLNRTEWVSEIRDYLSGSLDITNSDAQGMVSAYDFELAQEWAKDSSPQTAAERLISL